MLCYSSTDSTSATKRFASSPRNDADVLSQALDAGLIEVSAGWADSGITSTAHLKFCNFSYSFYLDLREPAVGVAEAVQVHTHPIHERQIQAACAAIFVAAVEIV